MSYRGPKEAEFITAIVLLAQGIPFLQLGQTFFRDKQGDHNSYKSGDAINHVPWRQLDAHREMHEALREMIAQRKELYRIKEGYSFAIEGDELHYHYGAYHIVFNPRNLEIDSQEAFLNSKAVL